MIDIKYHIIATIDIYNTVEGCRVSLADAKPSWMKRDFHVTENLPEDDSIRQHRKYVGMVSAEKLAYIWNRHYSDTCQNFDTCQTMGSVTLRGVLPAISWQKNEDGYSMNLHVSPVPADSDHLFSDLEELPEAQQKIKRFLIAHAIDQLLVYLEKPEPDPDDDTSVVFADHIDVCPYQYELELAT